MAKPASGTGLNTGHALYTNLLHAWGLLEGTGATSADSKGTNTLTLSAGSWSTDADGACWTIATANNAPIDLASDVAIGADEDWSIAFGMKQAANDSAGMMMGDNAATTAFIWPYSGGMVVRPPDTTFGNAAPFTTKGHYVVTYGHSDGAGGSVRCYKNGSEVTGSPVNLGNTFSDLTIKVLGNGYTSTTFGLVGDISYVYVWSGRVLDSTEVGTLNTNPYVIFSAGAGGLSIPVAMNQYRQRWG